MPRHLFEATLTWLERQATAAEGINATVNRTCVIHPESSRLGLLASSPQMPLHTAAVMAYGTQRGKRWRRAVSDRFIGGPLGRWPEHSFRFSHRAKVKRLHHTKSRKFNQFGRGSFVKVQVRANPERRVPRKCVTPQGSDLDRANIGASFERTASGLASVWWTGGECMRLGFGFSSVAFQSPQGICSRACCVCTTYEVRAPLRSSSIRQCVRITA